MKLRIKQKEFPFFCWLVVIVALLIGTSGAHAAGMFLVPRGVRPLARSGAYVAGADDVNSLSYNPAGIALGKKSVMIDFGLPMHFTHFTRTDSDGETVGETAGF